MTRRNKKSRDSIGNLAAQAASQEEKHLLQALQGFILPHIGVGADANRQQEMAQELAGPQAMKFITALKEFISSIVATSAKMKSKTTISVDFDEEEKLTPAEVDAQDSEGIASSMSNPAQRDLLDASTENHQLMLSVLAPTIHEKVLRELYYRVFNRMPIRLLRFVENGSRLEVTLLEHSAIYEHLVSVLQERQGDADYRPLLRPWGRGPESENEAVHRIIDRYTGYAILSHTWLRQSPELTYGDWNEGHFDVDSPGYLKLVNFCKVAYKAHGLTLGWMDTVCINKDSSSELDESIRSMYNWYKRSDVCVVYLAETSTLQDMPSDSWFTRGWTLQELLAPDVLKFYNQRWEKLVDSDNDKKSKLIRAQIGEATTLSTSELEDIHYLVPISRRMQLAAARKVTREEDTAYSLMGLFKVSIATAYGEGADRAFFRLMQEILHSQSHGVLDLFNWTGMGHSSTSKLLPTSPRQYLARASPANLQFYVPIEPLTLTHMGIRIPLLLMPGISIQEGASDIIEPCGNYSALVSVRPVERFNHLPTVYNLLQHQETRPDNHPLFSREQCQFTFAVFNIDTKGKDVLITSKCTAMFLACYSEETGTVSSTGQCERIYTKEPVEFDMLKRNTKQPNRSAKDYMVKVEHSEKIRIPQRDLAKHGMQLVFKYL